jgi:hypothetical protein
MLEQRVFILGMDTLEKAISSFLHLCFIGNVRYPAGSALLCTFLQRWVAKLDEHGTTATRTKKDKLAKEDKATRPFKKVIQEFKAKLWDIKHGNANANGNK